MRNDIVCALLAVVAVVPAAPAQKDKGGTPYVEITKAAVGDYGFVIYSGDTPPKRLAQNSFVHFTAKEAEEAYAKLQAAVKVAKKAKHADKPKGPYFAVEEGRGKKLVVVVVDAGGEKLVGLAAGFDTEKEALAGFDTLKAAVAVAKITKRPKE